MQKTNILSAIMLLSSILFSPYSFAYSYQVSDPSSYSNSVSTYRFLYQWPIGNNIIDNYYFSVGNNSNINISFGHYYYYAMFAEFGEITLYKESPNVPLYLASDSFNVIKSNAHIDLSDAEAGNYMLSVNINQSPVIESDFNYFIGISTQPSNTVPEPNEIALMLIGLGALAIQRKQYKT